METPMTARNRLLMCAPEFFTVRYEINPWMNVQRKPDAVAANDQWQQLVASLAPVADIVLCEQAPDAPDMVFTANAGFVFESRVVVSRFRHPERQTEEPHFARWFTDAGFTLVDWPEEVRFEGAGDCLVDRGERRLWLGHGLRSDPRAGAALQAAFDVPVHVLTLVDPRYYHLDTCFCPLADGYALYYPGAFSAESQMLIRAQIRAEKRIEVSDEDARHFACNAVGLGEHVFMNRASKPLRRTLESHGFVVHESPVGEFLRAGGAVKCLSLNLDDPIA
ncbi:MAG: nitrate reductase [Gammaproteobacteria bacterium]|nr:nitrate reductase [Gammaproteobacteria bacterium]